MLDFKTDEFVVYPAHGVGKISGIETQKVADIELEMFIVFFDKEKLTLKVPTKKALEVGMRPLSSREVLEQAIGILKGKARVKRAMWSRRAKEYEDKIYSGNLISIAEVVRDLHRGEDKEQSYSERQLYERALERLTSEMAIVDGLEEQIAQEKIDEVLGGRAA
tara:strand:+ start:2111 stop:2602 length:492 start_codon:yes stop_codon:yes gene_type:complete